MKPRSRQTPRVRPGRDESRAKPEKRPGAGWMDSKPARVAMVVLLLAIGAALRLTYAHGLPTDRDEDLLLGEAAKVSIAPGNFYLPLAEPLARHPGLLPWILAAVKWVASGNFFAMRSIFVLFHITGLFGLYCLTRHLLGHRAALLALAFGALDRFWIVASAQMLEPSSFFLAAWILLVGYQCVCSPWRSCWFVLGILLLIADFYYELSILMTIPVGFLLVSTPAGRKSLRTPGPYLAAALALGILVLVEIWNIRHHQGPFRYARGVFGSHSLIALSPRALLLYLADLIVPLKDNSLISFTAGSEIYAPVHVPCLWLAGLFYLACVAYGFRWARHRSVAFLLVAFFSVAIPTSLFPPRELWSNIHYGGQSVVVAIVLAGWVGSRISDRRVGRVALVFLFAFLGISILFFLRETKWGYSVLDDEMRYFGRVFYYRKRHDWNEQSLTSEDILRIRRLTGEMIRAHPESVLAQYYRGRFAANAEERLDALGQAKAIDPHAPQTLMFEAELLGDAGDVSGARDCLRKALDRGEDLPAMRASLAALECQLGDYGQAVKEAKRVLKSRPDYPDIYGVLFFIYKAQGKTEEAREALEGLCYWGRMSAVDANLYLAQECLRQGKTDMAASLMEEAFRLDPQSPKTQFAMGAVLAERGQLDRAEELFNNVLRADPTHAQARAWLEQVRQLKKTADRGDADAEDSEGRGRRTDR